MANTFMRGDMSLKKLADALGLSDKPITAITLVARVNEVTKLTVEMLAEVDGVEGICTVLKKYELVSLEQPLDPAPVGFAEALAIAAEATNQFAKSWRDKPPLA